ncbi:MAG: DUF2946 domain-containing protein [Burkholderiaceae bacterium]
MRPLRMLAWLALMSMLMVAAAPSVSRALAAADGSSARVTLCAEGGVRVVESSRENGDKSSGRSSGAVHVDDCPYCSVHLAKVLPPLGLAVSVPAPPWPSMPPRFFRSARTSHAWSRAWARAPPMPS